ncbi:MAG: PAS domain S-box protein [Alphaproteobacteria bacterium]
MSDPALKIDDGYQRLRRYLVSGYIIVTVVLIVMSFWYLQSERAAHLRLAESETSTLARALEEHVLRIFGSIDAMLRHASGRILERGDLETQDRASVQRLLREEAAHLPFVRSLYVDDRFGYGHATSQGMDIRKLRARDFEHIRHFYEKSDDQLYVGRPSKGSLTGHLNIPVARQMVNARGEFAGVIGTSIKPEYFEDFYKSLALSAGTSLSLVRSDGALLARVPAVPGRVDNVSQSRFFQEQVSQKPSGTLEVERSIIDGVARVLSFRRVGDTNLIVVIARARSSILASSQRLAFGVSAMVGSSLIALLFLLLLALRQLKHRAAAEERHALMIRGTQDGIWDWNVLTHECYLSPRWKEIVGFRDEALPNLESSFFERMHPDDQHLIKDAVDSHVEGQASYAVEMRLRHKDGHYRWVLMRGESVRDKQGGTIRMVGSTSDITERKAAEAKARQAAGELQAVFDVLPDLFFRLDLNGVIRGYHARSPGELYVSPERFLGKSLPEIFSDALAQQLLHAVQEAHRHNAMQVVNYELPMPDGHRSYEARILPIGQNEVIAVVRDITESGQLEMKLRESETRLRTIIDSTPECVKLLDASGTLLDMNPAGLAMIEADSLSQVQGSPTDELIAPEHRDKYIEFRHDVFRGSSRRCEFEIIGLKGTRRWLEAHAVPLRDSTDSNQVKQMLAVTRDITERKRAEEQTKASLREKETLLREIHHRVKNNLQIISSLLYLQSNTLADATARQALKESQDRVHSMALVHERLYRSSTLGAIDFGEHLRQLAGSVARSYGPASDRVRLAMELESHAVDLDLAIPVSLIFNEVLANAFKHAFPGERAGTVRVDFFADGSETLTLRVYDDGIGFAPDSDHDQGRSLGLKIVRNLTEQIYGHLEIQSHHGTTFQLSFANSKTPS